MTKGWTCTRVTERAYNCDVLVVGAGPAGLAAAVSADENGATVIVADDNPDRGGQIWRMDRTKAPSKKAALWFERIRNSKIKFVGGTQVFDRIDADRVVAETANELARFSFRKLILATGARERFLPFPGWTLPNVFGAGGLQALVKGGFSVKGKRVVVAGSGPLLIAVADYLREQQANVLLVAEQASKKSLTTFGFSLLRQAGKLSQAIRFRKSLRGVSYVTNCWPTSAYGETVLKGVRLVRGKESWEIDCDLLACGFHLVPNLELGQLLGCATREHGVSVDEFQKTSVANVYAAGEVTGIGGLELSLVEGEIAGLATVDRQDAARKLFPLRSQLKKFANALEASFALRPELKRLAQNDTVVCRCEDISLSALGAYDSWRSSKLQSRCGMGPCQGRICGSALQFLFGWRVESVRPPVFPVKLESLASQHIDVQ